jgi:ubiquitin-conjugating enzyme E2 D
MSSLQSQFNDLRSNPPEYVGVGLKNYNINTWEAFINGPRRTPYEGGLFTLSIKFPSNFPTGAPEVKMLTQIYHPNINEQGTVCIDIIRNNWRSDMTMRKVLIAIVGLLKYPNPDGAWPSKTDMANELRNNPSSFNRNAQEWTRRYAM